MFLLVPKISPFFFWGGGMSYNDWTLKLLCPSTSLLFPPRIKSLNFWFLDCQTSILRRELTPSSGWRFVIINGGETVHSRGFDTVDGSEILHPPVEVGSLSHYLQGFSTIPGGAGFLNHQQYVSRRIKQPFNGFFFESLKADDWLVTIESYEMTVF